MDGGGGVAAVAAQGALVGQQAQLGPAADGLGGDLMVLGETCKMAATSADRRKLAALGAGRADWLCIGTSFDALGAGGASPPPAPTLQNLVLASCAVSVDVVASPPTSG